jgi:hypothetical protein
MQLETTPHRYNGWTNYETWRVNLELFGGFDVSDYAPECIRDDDAYSLSKLLKEYADDAIDQDGTLEGLAVDYARAFLSGVNWYEIAEHLLDDIKAENAA